MKCSHLTTKAIYKNKILQGYKCIKCGEFLSKDKVFPNLKKYMNKTIKARLEYLRSEIKKECISTAEIAELESLKNYIEPGDTVLLEWAGVPEFTEDN